VESNYLPNLPGGKDISSQQDAQTISLLNYSLITNLCNMFKVDTYLTLTFCVDSHL